MTTKSKTTIRFTTAGLFIIAAIFSFLTEGDGFIIAGILYCIAALGFILSGVMEIMKKNKTKK